MSRRGTPSQLERGGAVSPSPARDALQGNLESSLTLNRKKSWFGSARGILSKAWRGDGTVKADESEDRTTAILNEETEIGQNDDNSATPLRPRPERQRTFTPRNAISSLRQHMTGSKDRHKRGALADITGNEMRTPVGPERIIVSPAPEDDDGVEQENTKTHTRKSSLGKSLVGSIRTLGRKTTLSRNTSPVKSVNELSPTKQAAAIPLPSSPIDIRPPPTLQIDLGPSALMGTSPESREESELMRLTNPDNFGARPLPTYYTRLPGQGPNDQAPSTISTTSSIRQSLTPSDLLQLPTDEFGFSIPEAPATPMPGSSQPMELDGANDATELFERSVEYKDKAKKTENRRVKKMVSLDAMAEECTNASSSSSPNKLSPGGKRRSRDLTSMTTIESCPEDMPEISRQLAHLSTPSAGHRDPRTGQWKSDDPFAPGNAIGTIATIATSGPPSPERSVKLPFRPKITVQAGDGVRPITLNESELATPEGLKDDGVECVEGVHEDPMVSTIKDDIRKAVELAAKTVPPPPDDKNKDQESLTDSIDSGEYDEFKTQQIFADLNEPSLPQYDGSPAGTDAELAATLHRKPSVSQIYERISKSQTPSPARCQPGTTHWADVGDVFWKFSIKDWMDRSKHHASAHITVSPRKSTDISIESASGIVDRKTPEASPTTTTPNRTPNMGDRLEFDMMRSDRNMRYNALANTSSPDHEDAAKEPSLPPSLRPSPLRPALKIDTNSEFKSRNSSDLSLADFEVAYSSSRQVSPLKARNRQQRVDMSSDSIDHDLKRAISQHYVFQAAVAGLGITEPYPSTSQTHTPTESQPLMARDYRSDSARGSAISPDSSSFWGEMQQGVFDTPPGGSNHSLPRGSSNTLPRGESLEFDTPFADPGSLPATDDSLDDCLQIIHNFNHTQDMLSSDTVQPLEKIENPFGSSPLEEKKPERENSSPVTQRKKPAPARYRSQRQRQM